MVHLRAMRDDEFDRVAELIFESTNYWYERHGFGHIFLGQPSDCRLFCEVYEDLDPGCCLLAIDDETEEPLGSCFYRSRETHWSLGIMNAHSKAAGKGVAKGLLREIIRRATEAGKPLRLFSSALNLDSYSLYTRSGLAPYAIFQDMILPVPKKGLLSEVVDTSRVRDATLEDLDSIVALEREVWGIGRAGDWKYFLENRRGIWHASVIEREDRTLAGVLASVHHPGSNMLGPGVALDATAASALILAELNVHRGRSPVFLVPAANRELVGLMYGLGARNCELHVGQSLGPPPTIKGVVLPTFMPETC
ncbi:hypothetical protein Pan216_19370 [Planctomycetes bacterium Pan216]|uniref:N-acetyltransferase domain-containing protein n=1 Tax=Kolteria novifilia TaxID=2527975 RepID=A0A518B267_9BACT|nr:hypothetical protein Pan216_19370 [Planctomycetes bacterium Pan216]